MTHQTPAIQEKYIREAVELLHPTETDWVIARYLEGLLSVTVREQIGAVASALAERDAKIAEMEGVLKVADKALYEADDILGIPYNHIKKEHAAYFEQYDIMCDLVSDALKATRSILNKRRQARWQVITQA